ncbi:MAG: hypothetical protein JO232_14765 [Verrucomicrobia bacterium]|nr:hypothetical protein [Verrucomicrobiota bacterium]
MGDGCQARDIQLQHPERCVQRAIQRMALLGILAGELLAETTRCARDENPRFGWCIYFIHLQGGTAGEQSGLI